jgi:phosphatidylglycerol:prolipoprotein diacylglycerol transferase
MFPTLLTVGPFELSTYGVLVAAGYMIGILWLKRHRSAMGLEEEPFWDVVYWLFGGAILGGKLGYVLVQRDPTLLWHDIRYGFVFYGGFLGAMLAGWFASKRMHFSFLKLSDYFAVALPLGHAVGRLGCLAAGCCYGAHTDLPWGLGMAGDASRHPTQIYESLANILIAVVIARWALPRVREGRWKQGSAFFIYVTLYAMARFLVEMVRADDRGFSLLGLSPSQLICLSVLPVVGVCVCKRK